MSAVFSPCRTWRYTLTRVIAASVFDRKLTDLSVPEGEVGHVVSRWHFEHGGKGTVAFIGLNPSTADETVDDPTIRRCMGFARRWGYDRMVMLNAFAFRATDPKVMKAAANPIGPENDEHLVREAGRADLVVCCWGNHGLWHPHPSTTLTRQEDVYDLLREAGVKLYALGTTKQGAPSHPLYLRADLEPVEWDWPER